MYIDGEFEVQDTGTIDYNTGINRFSVGRLSTGTPVSYFNGTIDDIRLYSRALSESEIKAVQNEFREFQAIPTSGALDWEPFNINDETYLAVANSGNGSSTNIDSKIYQWDGNSFVEIQSIPTIGAYDWESFVIDEATYLAVAN